MPTQRDREDRRRAEKRLETEYGWPAPRRRTLADEVDSVALAVVLVVVVALVAVALGWNPFA